MERNTDSESHRTSKAESESERRTVQRRREVRREHKRIRIVEDGSDRRQDERREE